VRLLVYLLCELRTTYGITARRLREADQPIRRQITPVERLQMMDELYEVREEEEKFLDGTTGKLFAPYVGAKKKKKRKKTKILISFNRRENLTIHRTREPS